MVELFFDAVKAVTFPTEHVFLVQFHVVKSDFTAAIHTQTELFKFGHFDARFAHINKPFGVDRFVRRSPVARHHHDVRGVGAAGNKTLTTIKINLTISTGISRFQSEPAPGSVIAEFHICLPVPRKAMILSICSCVPSRRKVLNPPGN